MDGQYRSVRTTANGVNKIRQARKQRKEAINVRSNEEATIPVSEGTINRLLTSEPVFVHSLQAVFEFYGLTLEREDWEPVTSFPPSPAESPSLSDSGLTSSDIFPMDKCRAKLATAGEVCFLSTWLINREILPSLLVDSAVKGGARTRILVLDPHSLHVVQRGIDLNISRFDELQDSEEIEAEKEAARKRVNDNILGSLQEISALAPRRQPCERLEVRVFDSTPTMTLLIVDGYVCQGFHWRNHQGSSRPHLEYTQERNPLWYQAALEHFNAVWDSKTTSPYNIGTGYIHRDTLRLQAMRAAEKD